MSEDSFKGTIVSFDAADGLGSVLLDDGRTVRFGLRACGPMKPERGVHVVVQEVAPGFGGTLRAARVRPAIARSVETIQVWPEPWVQFEEGGHWEVSDRRYVRFDPESFHVAKPEWVDTSATSDVLVPLRTIATFSVPESPPQVFAPWIEQIAHSAGVTLRLQLGDATGESRLFARSAALEGTWHDCARCSEPLALVFYIKSQELRFLDDENAYLAAFLCTQCCNEIALGEAQWRFECGIAQEVQVQPSLRKAPKIDLPPVQHIGWACAPSYPDPRTLAKLRGAASEVLSVVIRQQPQPHPLFPKAKETRLPASHVYREWLEANGKQSQLGGFLNWRHELDGEHPTCAECKKSMRLLCSLSEEDSGLHLGDDVGGTLYFLFCERTSRCQGVRDIRVVHQFE